MIARGMALATLAWLAFSAAPAHAADDGTPPPPEKDYTVVAETAPAELALGSMGTLSITIKPKPPWALKVTTPFETLLTATAGVELGKAKLTSKDFVDPKAADKQVAAPFTLKAAGPQSINAALNFFLCTEQVCQRYKEAVETKLPAK